MSSQVVDPGRATLSSVLEQRAALPPVVTSPWGVPDHVRLAQALVLGVVGLLVGWYGLAQTVALSRQGTFLVVGIAGLLVSFSGLALWLLVGLRAIRDRRLRVRGATELVAEGVGSRTPTVTAPRRAEGLVATDAMTHYHLALCLLVEGKPTRPGSLREHEQAGRSACPVCRP